MYAYIKINVSNLAALTEVQEDFKMTRSEQKKITQKVEVFLMPDFIHHDLYVGKDVIFYRISEMT